MCAISSDIVIGVKVAGLVSLISVSVAGSAWGVFQELLDCGI